CQQDYITPWTF
nr:immunoglobulin light chain junction region [Macaca mulatta]MPN88970.1 immunoglobulin light chain junction region [Macaca mulatta]MPN89556.1 immunoglobulin light chain junction region [Macaca mulatta]